jgi:hypothetical protein
MDNRPDENGLVNNHIPKSGFFKTDLDSVMNLGLLTGYFAHPYSEEENKNRHTKGCFQSGESGTFFYCTRRD